MNVFVYKKRILILCVMVSILLASQVAVYGLTDLENDLQSRDDMLAKGEKLQDPDFFGVNSFEIDNYYVDENNNAIIEYTAVVLEHTNVEYVYFPISWYYVDGMAYEDPVGSYESKIISQRSEDVIVNDNLYTIYWTTSENKYRIIIPFEKEETFDKEITVSFNGNSQHYNRLYIIVSETVRLSSAGIASGDDNNGNLSDTDQSIEDDIFEDEFNNDNLGDEDGGLFSFLIGLGFIGAVIVGLRKIFKGKKKKNRKSDKSKMKTSSKDRDLSVIDDAAIREYEDENKKEKLENKEKPKDIEKNVKYCSNCGTALKENAMFCGECGNKLNIKDDSQIIEEDEYLKDENNEEDDKKYYIDGELLKSSKIERKVDSSKVATIIGRVNDEKRDIINDPYMQLIIDPSCVMTEYLYVDRENIDGETYFYITYHKTRSDKEITFPAKVVCKIVTTMDAKPKSKVFDFIVEQPEPDKIKVNKASIAISKAMKKLPEIYAEVITYEHKNYEFKAVEIDETIFSKIDVKKGEKPNAYFVSYVINEEINIKVGETIKSKIRLTAFDKENDSNCVKDIEFTYVEEGLILVSQDPIKIECDGGFTKTELAISAIMPRFDEVFTDYKLLENLTFESAIEFEDELSKNAFSAAKVIFEKQGWSQTGEMGSGYDSYIYKVYTENALPGKSQSYKGTLKCRASNSKETYDLSIPLKLHIPSDGPGSHSWQQALERCNKIIEYLPKSNQSKLRQIVDERSVVLGAEGLDELRKRIWKTGIKLWEGEGGKGYEDEAEWAQGCENYFSFIEVSCDIALDILEKYSGTTLAGYIKPIKDVLKSFIIAYSEDKNLDEWLVDNYLGDVIKLYESIEKSLAESELDDKFRDYVVDFSSGILKSKEVTEEIETYFKKNYKAKIVIGAIQFYICVIEGFTKDYKDDETVIDVFLKAIEKFGKEQLSDFVGGKLYKKFGPNLKDKTSKYTNKRLKDLDNGNNPVDTKAVDDYITEGFENSAKKITSKVVDSVVDKAKELNNKKG